MHYNKNLVFCMGPLIVEKWGPSLVPDSVSRVSVLTLWTRLDILQISSFSPLDHLILHNLSWITSLSKQLLFPEALLLGTLQRFFCILQNFLEVFRRTRVSKVVCILYLLHKFKWLKLLSLSLWFFLKDLLIAHPKNSLEYSKQWLKYEQKHGLMLPVMSLEVCAAFLNNLVMILKFFEHRR